MRLPIMNEVYSCKEDCIRLQMRFDQGSLACITCENRPNLEFTNEKKEEVEPMKTEWHLLPIEAIEAAAKVMTAAKSTGHHAENTWQGETSEKQYDCMMRHLMADKFGEIVCDDFGLDHLDHFITRALMYWTLKKKEGNWREETR